MNKLVLNLNKSKFMVITHQKHNSPSILMNGSLIDRTSDIRFLGINIDSSLTFQNHSYKIGKTLSRNIGILYRISTYMPSSVLAQLYFSFVQSHICFGLPVWGCCAPTNLSRIKNLRFRSAQLCGVDLTSLNFENMYKYTCIVKFMKDFVFSNYLDLSNLIPQHYYNTRHRLNLNMNIPPIRKTRCKQSFIYNSIHFWNNLPDRIRNSDSICSLKTNLKKYLLTRQNSN